MKKGNDSRAPHGFGHSAIRWATAMVPLAAALFALSACAEQGQRGETPKVKAESRYLKYDPASHKPPETSLHPRTRPSK